ncbi:TadE/TadG family type IV pilus assembly protein [Pedococcus sp. 5OH_020]|uniref:TadE/TadG family type IV pilus assembly protein n=1 Tax=Pedococcus sp. 5OH_020 TaxID=2989814 RepID=UPI0022E9DC1E|nr:Tad domain-containing protein [Pedococcus sp. 5OH_020]
MTRLARLTPASLSRERGAVATIVAVLFGGGVLFGFVALSIDVGSIMFERRQLQNGADSGAVALARACASSAAACAASTGTVTNSTLTRLNNVNNNKDSLGGLDPAYPNPSGGLVGLCASSSSLGLAACPAPSSAITDCSPVPTDWVTNGVPYVEVHTMTKEAGANPTILPNQISRMVVGGNTGESVKACARAGWGSPGSGGGSLPLTVSGCDWMHATGGNAGGGGGAYYASPVYTAASPKGYGGAGQPAWPAAAATPPAQNPGGEVILMLQSTSSGGSHITPTSCPSWSGHALPGGFGMLETVSSSSCLTKEFSFNWVHTSTGQNTACDLSAYVGKVVAFPVFDCTALSLPTTSAIPPPGGNCTEANGNNAYFHRQGVALFYLSGYAVNVTGSATNKVKSLVSNTFPCSGGDSCISGWFVSGELQSGNITGPPSGGGYFGAIAVVAAG